MGSPVVTSNRIRGFLRAWVACWAIPASAVAERPLTVSNGSFETPSTGFVTLQLDGWVRLEQPADYVGDDWNTLTGIFANTAPGATDHIGNLDGKQALWIFNIPGAGITQVLADGAGGPGSAVFAPGTAYRIAVDVLGGGGNMPAGSRLETAIGYRDPLDGDAFITVAALPVVQDPAVFPDRQHVVPFDTAVAPLPEGHPALGRAIHLQVVCSTPEAGKGGYWDIDNIRVFAEPPALTPPTLTWSGSFPNEWEIRWAGAAGWIHQLERSVDLLEWIPVGDPMPGTGETIRVPVDGAGTPNGFLRVISTRAP